MRKLRRPALLIAASAVVWALQDSTHLQAQVLSTWRLPVSGEFTSNANWSNNIAPTNANINALINVVGTYTISSTVPSQITTGQLTLDADGARLNLINLRATGGLFVNRGIVELAQFTGPSFVTSPTGFAKVSSLYCPEIGGRVEVSGTSYATTVTLRPGTILSTQGVSFAPPSGVNASILGEGTIVATGRAAISAFPNGAVIIGPNITVAPGGIGQNFQAGIQLTGVHNQGTVLTDVPAGATVIDGSTFAGTNSGAIRTLEHSTLRQFSGVNTGTIDVFARPGSTIRVDFGSLSNSGTINLTRVIASLSQPYTPNPGSAFRIVDGGLSVNGFIGLSALSTIERENSYLEIAGAEVDLQQSQLAASTNQPVRIRSGVLRRGTLTGTPGSISFPVEGFNLIVGLDAMNLDIDLNAGATSLSVINGLTLNKRLTVGTTTDSISKLISFDSTQTLQGPGTLELITPPNFTPLQGTFLRIIDGAILTTSPQTNIRATNFAQIGSSNSTTPAPITGLINQGTITATPSTFIKLNVPNFSNQGLIRLESESTLAVDVEKLPQLGQVERDPTSTVRIEGSKTLNPDETLDLSTSPVGPLDLGSIVISGGRITSPGRPVSASQTSTRNGAVTRITDSVIATDFVLNNASLELINSPFENSLISMKDSSLSVVGPLNGVATVQFVTDPLSSTASLSRLTVSSVGENVVIRAQPGTTANIGPASSGTVVYSGPLEVNGGQLNLGRPILSDPSTPLVSSLNGNTTVSSPGRLEVRGDLIIGPSARVNVHSGASMVASSTILNQGHITIASGATLTLFAPTTGVISGNAIELNGTLLVLNGSFFAIPPVQFNTPPQLSDQSTLAFRLASTPTRTGRLSIAGDFVGRGSLQFELPVGTRPLPGSLFTLLSANLTNEFTSQTYSGFLPGYVITTTISDAGITLRLDARFMGDANLDNFVGVADLDLLGANYNRTPRNWFQGNFNTDTSVNLADLELLGANWQASLDDWYAGLTRNNLPLVVIPEPSNTALILLALPLLKRRRHKHS